MAGSSTPKAQAQTTSSLQAKWYDDLQKQLGAQTAAMSNTIAPMQQLMNAGGEAPAGGGIWNQAPQPPLTPAAFSNLPGGTGRVDPAGSGNNGGNGAALNNLPSGGMGQL